jgi:hypothetical protein
MKIENYTEIKLLLVTFAVDLVEKLLTGCKVVPWS